MRKCFSFAALAWVALACNAQLLNADVTVSSLDFGNGDWFTERWPVQDANVPVGNRQGYTMTATRLRTRANRPFFHSTSARPRLTRSSTFIGNSLGDLGPDVRSGS